MTGTRTCLAVILAAGEGTRMNSHRPKVLHKVAGRSMLAHVAAAARAASVDGLVVVIGSDRPEVAAAVRAAVPEAEIAVQSERRGTAHAVLAARSAIERGYDDLLVLYGDVPLVLPATLGALREGLWGGADVVALGFEPDDPTGYGRLLTRSGDLLAIREHKDATEEERQVGLCNSGLMALDGNRALALLERIDCRNQQGEFYLTDAVEAARADGGRCVALRADADELMGINDRAQLAAAEAEAQRRLRLAAMRAGVTLIAPDTVFLSHDTRLGRDVTVEPHVWFGPGVRVDDGALIRGFSHLEGAHVGPGVEVGPFARLRPGATLGARAKVGNFVEIKGAEIGEGAKVSHLTYVGDAVVGPRANLGAGTVTCNYDGFGKFRTEIGADAFIGSNSSLVAPVTIGQGAFVGSGSVVTDPVPEDALALGRGRQVVKPGWAAAFRARHAKKP